MDLETQVNEIVYRLTELEKKIYNVEILTDNMFDLLSQEIPKEGGATCPWFPPFEALCNTFGRQCEWRDKGGCIT